MNIQVFWSVMWVIDKCLTILEEGVAHHLFGCYI